MIATRGRGQVRKNESISETTQKEETRSKEEQVSEEKKPIEEEKKEEKPKPESKAIVEQRDIPALHDGSQKAKVYNAKKVFDVATLQSMLHWLKPEKPSTKVDFSSEKSAKIRFDNTGLSWAVISKGDQPARGVPFVWQQDKGTRRTWAVFDWDEFYGKPIPTGIAGFFSPRITTKVLLIPFDKSPDMCSYYGRGYLAKFDEISEMQISLHIHDSEPVLKKRLEDRSFIAEDLQLYRMLQDLSKPKYNWSQIMTYLAIAAVVLIGGYIWFTHPQLLGQIQHFIGLGG